MDEWLVERVLTCVELVPAGRVVSYGDVAGLVGTGPRQVGAVMREHGALVPWWRVTSATGELPAHLHQAVAEHWAAEGIRWKTNRRGCRIGEHRADLPALADAYEADLASRQ